MPTTDPGFSLLEDPHDGERVSTFNTFYDDVRVADDAIIGELNRGWDLIINQLNYERVVAGAAGHGRADLRGRRRVGQGDQAARRPAA